MASISKRKDGKWLGQVNKNGKRKSFYGDTKKEVEKKIQEYTHDINSYGVELDKVSMNIQDLMYTHLFTNVKARVSLGTFERYMSLYNTHIKGTSFGKIDVKVAMHKDIQKFINDKYAMSSKSLSMLKYLLSQSFGYAIVSNLIRINPMLNVAIPKSTYKEKDIEVLTLEEQTKFMTAFKDTHYELLFILELNTGLRVGEIIALRWENVDLDNNIIQVRESKRLVKEYDKDGKSKDIFDTKEPKTKSGVRDIPVHKEIKEMLNELKTKNKGTDKDLVFLNTKGHEIKYDSIAKTHKLLCEKAKIKPYEEIGESEQPITKYKGVTFHCLRHTFATRLIEQGIDVKTVSQLLGHSKVDITLNRYVHSTANTKIQAIEKLYNSYSSL